LERLESLLQQGRRVVLVSNHALDIIDPLLFTTALIDRCGCMPYFIGHENMVFNAPGLGDLAKRFHMVPSRQMEDAVQALQNGGMLMLYPACTSRCSKRWSSHRHESFSAAEFKCGCGAASMPSQPCDTLRAWICCCTRPKTQPGIAPIGGAA
jgi:1-acyl-sn-glycerol-3-phosphate acyltransferase